VARVKAFKLGQNRCAQAGGKLVQSHQRRPADGLGNIGVNVHLSTFFVEKSGIPAESVTFKIKHQTCKIKHQT
jgi:hypothetical protein